MKWFILLLALFPLCTFAQKKNLYYLCIGNGHYGNFFATEPNAVLSAKLVGQNLAKYGKGEVLASRYEAPLTKDLIMSAVERLLDNSMQDTAAIVYFYYCGHGQADRNNDNLFFIPGVLNIKNTSLNKHDLNDSLINIRDIQALYEKYLEKKFKGNEKVTTYISLLATQIMAKAMKNMKLGNSTDTTQVGKLLNDTTRLSNTIDSVVKTLNIRLPHLVIAADCCTENFKTKKTDYFNYPHANLQSTKEQIEKTTNDTLKVAMVLAFALDTLNNTHDAFF